SDCGGHCVRRRRRGVGGNASRRAKKTLHASLLIELARRWDDQLVRSRVALREFDTEDGAKRLCSRISSLKKNDRERIKLLAVANYFGLVGALVERKIVSTDAVFMIVGGWII